jgi:hypothetical protein
MSTMKMAGSTSTPGGAAAAPAAAAPTVAVADPPSHSAEVFLLGSGIAFFTLVGSSIYAFRYKPE